MQGTQVQLLIRELRSYIPRDVWLKKKKISSVRLSFHKCVKLNEFLSPYVLYNRFAQ